MKFWLNKYRKKIDKIDKKIVKLLEKRGMAALKIAEIKYQNGEKIYDPTRETALLERILKFNSAINNPFNNQAIQNIYKIILNESRLLQEKNVFLDNYKSDQITKK